MNLKNFEKHIDKKILERGTDYYKSGSVIDLVELKKGKWSAKVEGTELYEIVVEIRNGEIAGSVCDCPYDMGPVCKHEVAVFFEIRDLAKDKKKGKKSGETRESKVEKLLDGQDREELKQIIKDKALEDEKFFNYLVSCFSKSDHDESRSHYRKYIKASINSISDRHGFIDYYRADESADIGFGLLDDAGKLLGKKQYEAAMNIAQAVIEVFVPSLGYTDDSAGGQGMVIEDAFDFLFKAAENKLPDELRKKTLTYYLRQAEKNVYDDYGSWQHLFIELALLMSDLKNEVSKVLTVVEKIIANELKGESYSDYKLEKYSLLKYQLLQKLGNTDEAETFFSKCLIYPGFRRIKFKKLLKKKDYEAIVELAFDGEKNDAKYPGLLSEWKGWRLKAYEKLNDIEHLESLAFEMLVKGNELKYYEVYKKACKNKNWDKKYTALKNELIKKDKNGFNVILADILVKENEFPELLEMLKNDPWYVESYQKHFLKTHPEEIYSLHAANIRDEAAGAGNRKDYRSVCRYIKELKKIGGKLESKQLVEDLRETYNKRPAFMDELSKVKI